ncbi:MAG: carbamoyltransferase N-terminal domain-containing protein [Nonlabens sp.]
MKSTFRQTIQYDKKLGHKYVPNQTACLKYGKGTYLVETDENGFRNSLNKNKGGKLKIICIGDSYVAGDGVSNKYRFTDLLEKEYDCEVLNLGVSGYGIDQQLLVYEEYSKNFEHDLLLFCPFLGDVQRNLLSAREGKDRKTGGSILIPKPYFSLEDGNLELKNVPVPREKEVIDRSATENELPLKSIRGKLSKNDTLKAVVKKSRDLKKNYKAFLRRNIHDTTSYPSTDNIDSPAWKITIPIIERLKKSAGNRPVIILPLPQRKMIDFNENTNHYISIFKKFEDDSTTVIDINPIFKKHNVPADETVFLNICWHLSHSGHKLTAQEIGNVLKSRYGLETRNKIADSDKRPNRILGISCLYHDSAASIIVDGKVKAAAQEERFTRVKHDKSFPINAINYCLEEEKISIHEVSKIVYYDYESWTIERTLWNALNIADDSKKFLDGAKQSLSKKLFLSKIIRHRTGFKGEIFKCQHHVSHAAGAYYPSPYKEAAILVIDGVGEWACTTIARAKGNRIEILKQQHYPHSLGLLYSAFTYYTGFKVNSGEYKLMGLAPYGKPIYADLIKEKLIDVSEDGSIKLDMSYFSFQKGEAMTNSKFDDLFGGPARDAETEITMREMHLASSIQVVTEEIVVKMANHAHELTGCDNLVMSGGVALNCVSNGILYEKTPFKEFYFQPASGDAGGAVGCALMSYFEDHPQADKTVAEESSAYLGPEFNEFEISAFLDSMGYPYKKVSDTERGKNIAEILNNNLIIGHFDGRMEFGPRALGARSIMGNPLNSEMQSKLNLKIKYRESFRPFAPIYLEERTSDYFDFDRPSPYMLVVRQVNEKLLHTQPDNEGEEDLLKIINQVRSDIPAITHVDNSARLQSVSPSQNKRIHDILSEFEKLAGKGILINTSFNVRGEPIVCTPEDAYRCFMRTEMDVLVLGNYILYKEEQPVFEEDTNWKETFALD